MGRRRVVSATTRAGEDKDGPSVFPGGGGGSAMLVCCCGYFGWAPAKSRTDDLIEKSEILADVFVYFDPPGLTGKRTDRQAESRDRWNVALSRNALAGNFRRKILGVIERKTTCSEKSAVIL